MTAKEAKQIAATRGFTGVGAWMNANRKAWHEFNSRLSIKGENRDRLESLMARLDSEFDKFRNYQ